MGTHIDRIGVDVSCCTLCTFVLLRTMYGQRENKTANIFSTAAVGQSIQSDVSVHTDYTRQGNKTSHQYTLQERNHPQKYDEHLGGSLAP